MGGFRLEMTRRGARGAIRSVLASIWYCGHSSTMGLECDDQFPGKADWRSLNTSVGGRLIAGTPLAQSCHGEFFNQSACDIIQDGYSQPPLYFQDPVNVMSPYWLNMSCSPFTPADAPCILGSIAAQAHRRGGLALWTHNLKHISFLNYSSPHYTGPAVKLGAGVQAVEVYQAAQTQGLRVTGGFCPTVGLAGGYIQGAGHGALEGLYGLAADNTLEFEVVTTEGQHLVATPTNNSDQYWALNGGGGSTFRGFTSEPFQPYYATLPDADEAAMAAAMAPFIQELETLGLSYTNTTSYNPTYYDHFAQYTPGLPFGSYATNSVIGGRLIARLTVQDRLGDLMSAFRNITTAGGRHPFRVNGVASNVTHGRVGNAAGANAVHPAWRDALYWLNMDVYFDERGPAAVVGALQARMNAYQDVLKALMPGGGAYMNKGTFDNPEWKADYYGPNYERLLGVKARYDPGFLLYGPASVGSDYWTVAADVCRITMGRSDYCLSSLEAYMNKGIMTMRRPP
ncbi:hypothetical protein DL769_003188 [Monosporascus sp. CRB-8-3]|nr:hypothetical protein DL769_003188 [Monosporascus sp. CRB-8-3]